MTPILHQFSISHYCEKARWALDHAGVKYDLRNHIPGVHARRMKRLGPRTSVPVLEIADGAIQGSSAIVDYAAAHGGADLNPTDMDAARTDEAWVDLEIGEMIRSAIYRELVLERAQLVDMWAQDGPWWGKGFLTVLFPVVRKAVRAQYVDKPRLRDSVERLSAAITALDARYAQGPFLADGRFTRLDLTVASLMAPLVQPPQHAFRWPDREFPPSGAALLARHREGPTFQRVAALYAEHRQP